MKSKSIFLHLPLFSVLSALPASAVVLAEWTFEVSAPTTGGPHVAEGGIYATTSFASSNSGGTFSNPVGNGSGESFSSNGWTTGEYYQFTTSSVDYTEGITVSFAQAASSSGPGNFIFQYSTDGITYSDFGTAYAGPTADFSGTTFRPENVLTFNLSAIAELNNNATIGFRVTVADTTSETGGTISDTGTFRVDDFTVNAIPEPSAALLGAIGALGLLRRRR